MATEATITQESMYGYSCDATIVTSGGSPTTQFGFNDATINGVYFSRVGSTDSDDWANGSSKAGIMIQRKSDGAVFFIRNAYADNENMFSPAPNTYGIWETISVAIPDGSGVDASYAGDYVCQYSNKNGNPKTCYIGWIPSKITTDYVLPVMGDTSVSRDIIGYYPLTEEAWEEAKLAYINQMNYTEEELAAGVEPNYYLNVTQPTQADKEAYSEPVVISFDTNYDSVTAELAGSANNLSNCSVAVDMDAKTITFTGKVATGSSGLDGEVVINVTGTSGDYSETQSVTLTYVVQDLYLSFTNLSSYFENNVEYHTFNYKTNSDIDSVVAELTSGEDKYQVSVDTTEKLVKCWGVTAGRATVKVTVSRESYNTDKSTTFTFTYETPTLTLSPESVELKAGESAEVTYETNGAGVSIVDGTSDRVSASVDSTNKKITITTTEGDVVSTTLKVRVTLSNYVTGDFDLPVNVIAYATPILELENTSVSINGLESAELSYNTNMDLEIAGSNDDVEAVIEDGKIKITSLTNETTSVTFTITGTLYEETLTAQFVVNVTSTITEEPEDEEEEEEEPAEEPTLEFGIASLSLVAGEEGAITYTGNFDSLSVSSSSTRVTATLDEDLGVVNITSTEGEAESVVLTFIATLGEVTKEFTFNIELVATPEDEEEEDEPEDTDDENTDDGENCVKFVRGLLGFLDITLSSNQTKLIPLRIGEDEEVTITNSDNLAQYVDIQVTDKGILLTAKQNKIMAKPLSVSWKQANGDVLVTVIPIFFTFSPSV